MKKSLIFAVLIALSAAAPSYAVNSATASITEVTFMGGLWQNANRGGYTFKTTAMPAGITYFIVRGPDMAAKNFISVILAAKASGMKIMVNYNVTATEGDVVAITIP